MHEGKIIRLLRKEKGITQEELAYGICSKRYLRDIELGKVMASYDMISGLNEKLGGDIHLLVGKDVQTYGLDLYKEIRQIKNMFESWEYDKLQQKVINLLQNDNYNLSYKLSQELKYYEAVCLREVKGDLNGTKTLLMNIIECSSHNEVIEYLGTIRSRIELHICNGIGVCYYHEKKYRIARTIFMCIKDNLQCYDQTGTDFKSKINYNCLKVSDVLGHYDEVVELATENIRLCKETKYVEGLRKSYLYLAKGVEKRGDDQAMYLQYYEKYLLLGVLFEENGKIDRNIEEVIEKYPIRFDIRDWKGEV